MIENVLTSAQVKELSALIDGAENIVITGHMSPDGDAMGSCLGLAHTLTFMGKTARVVVPDEPGKQLMFLPGAKDVVIYCKYTAFATQLLAEADLIFCLDYNAMSRIDRMGPAVTQSPAPKVMIDHHLRPEQDGLAMVVSRPELSSTCMLLFMVMCNLGLLDAIDTDAATCLMAGMMTDTGNLSYNSNDPRIFYIMAKLLEKGVDRDALARKLFDTHTEWHMRLNAFAILERMKVWRDYGAALITLTRDELNRFHYSRGDTEGLVNRPLAIPGVAYSVFLREEEHYIKVSMRSVGDFPCDQVCARYFNGGGHKNAAGGEFRGSMQQCVDVFKSILPENAKLIK